MQGADTSADTGVRFTIALEPGADPIAGWLESPEGERREFSGYMGLIALLEALRMPGGDPGASPGAGRFDPRRASPGE